MTPRAAVIASLPPMGARAMAAHVVASTGLRGAVAWAALAALCAEGVATVVDGWAYPGRLTNLRRAS